MEAWVPLFDIFLNSPSPESEASRWFQQSFDASSSSSSTTITTLSFLSLLTKPSDAIVVGVDDSSIPTTSASPLHTKRVMWMQTLPFAVQSRILSFLVLERNRFCGRDLSRLARNVLRGNEEVDFWVKKAAYNLLDAVSELGYEWISGLSLDSVGDGGGEEFESVPGWLKDEARVNDPVLPWLPISPDELNSRTMFESCEDVSDSFVEAGEDDEEILDEVAMDVQIIDSTSAVLDPEIRNMAASLSARIINFESTSKTVALASEIRQLCSEKGGDSFAVLGLIEPWKTDDETALVLISHLLSGSEEEELGWPSQVLCSVILPKFLFLEEPASRVLLNATIEYCKLHQRAAVYALLFPLILRRDGINNFICDVITRIIKECLHSAHVSAFCHKLLCEEEDAKRFICLPCHQCLLSKNLVWTESMFNLFQNILNHNVHLTQDSVDHLVYQVYELTERFSKSLKFGNFLLCFITKCSSLLRSHKLSLTEAVGRTNSIVTKSVLAKLMNL